ncbi:response regulator [Salinimicrobium sediminilitoris]|uniref:response regulator n=1 Tax=Salinimicrobium sediminilitoris TaxID=2876715 RepID=UPI001E4F14C9|nr:response regulator [Salinimicrobium sediminilitoris]MCC8358981.1 response regulator [Salinimicrobium sediminilitoris]
MITIPLRILLVEDNEADVLVTRRTIQKLVESPEIEVVEDLSSCRDKLNSFIPDVVISDYNLPTCTGFEILQLVHEKNPALPFIFLTGTMHNEELAANTILAGASGFILKKHMNNLEEKLEPLLKKVVFKLSEREGVRERLRNNKIAVNQIYDYLDNLNADNREQKENIGKIKETIRKNNLWSNEDDRKA